MKVHRSGAVLAGAYVALVLGYTAYVYYRLTFAPLHSEFLGVPLIMLSMPWSLAMMEAADMGSGNAQTLGTIAIVAGAAINTAVLYVLGAAVSRTRGRSRHDGRTQ